MKSNRREVVDAENPQLRRGGTAAPEPRKAYRPPELRILGDIRDITLGGTFGAGDSTPLNTQPF